MYYISQNRSELEDYNKLVTESEAYDGRFTTDWASIIEHQNGNLFAIFKHENYPVELEQINNLDDWFNLEI